MLLNEEERVVADNGYIFDSCITLESVRDIDKLAHAKIRAQHESYNTRIESFDTTTRQTFRHCVQHRSAVFHAIPKLAFLMIKTPEPFFREL